MRNRAEEMLFSCEITPNFEVLGEHSVSKVKIAFHHSVVILQAEKSLLVSVFTYLQQLLLQPHFHSRENYKMY